MKTFEDLKPQKDSFRVFHARMEFPNGYGISVVSGLYTYGGERGLFEIAVLKDSQLCYDTPITSDVIGNLTGEQVTDIMRRIQELPPA